MDFLKDLILPPAAEHLGMLPFLTIFLLLFHLPFAGLTLVSSLASLGLRRSAPALAERFFRLLPAGAGAWLILGILPPFALFILLGQYFFNIPLPILEFYFKAGIPMLSACILLFGYRRLGNPLLGLLGGLLMLIAEFMLIAVQTLLFSSDAWPFIKTPVPAVFSISVLTQLLLFLLFALLFTGASFLLFTFRWPDNPLAADDPHAPIFRKTALGMLLGAAMLLPPALAWDTFNVPVPAVTPSLFVLGILGVAALAVIALAACRMLREGNTRLATRVFVLALVFGGLLMARNHSLQAGAVAEYHYLLTQQAEKVRTAREAKRQELYASAVVADLKLGEDIFNQRCSACHDFEKRVYGPPYNSVLPKYKDRLNDLKAFIRNPVKVNPAYPPMPPQALDEQGIASVAAFLLKSADEKK